MEHPTHPSPAPPALARCPASMNCNCNCSAGAAQAQPSQARDCFRADLSLAGEHIALLVDVHLRAWEDCQSAESAHCLGSRLGLARGVLPGPELLSTMLVL